MSPPGPARPGVRLARAPAPARPHVQPVERSHWVWRTVDVEQLREPDHPARAIWALTGPLDLSGFYAPIASVEGSAGQHPYRAEAAGGCRRSVEGAVWSAERPPRPLAHADGVAAPEVRAARRRGDSAPPRWRRAGRAVGGFGPSLYEWCLGWSHRSFTPSEALRRHRDRSIPVEAGGSRHYREVTRRTPEGGRSCRLHCSRRRSTESIFGT